MVTKSWKYWDTWKIKNKLVNGIPQNVQVALFCLVPDVMWWQVSRPNDVVDILRHQRSTIKHGNQ